MNDSVMRAVSWTRSATSAAPFPTTSLTDGLTILDAYVQHRGAWRLERQRHAVSAARGGAELWT